MPDEAHRTADPRVFQRLLILLRPFWLRIALGIGLLLMSIPCELFAPLVWKWVTDVIALQRPTDSPGWLMAVFSFNGHLTERYALLMSAMLWMFTVYAIGEFLQTLSQFVLNVTAQKFILGFRNRVYHKLQSQSLGYLQRQRLGDLMSRAMGDVDELQSFIVGGIETIVGEGLMWLGTVAIVMWIDWRVGSVSIAPLIVVYIMLRFFNKRIQPIYRAARERAGDVSTRLQENLSGLVVIKIFGREKQEAERFQETTQAYYDQQVKGVKARSLFFPFSRAVGFLSNVFMIGVGGFYMVKDGSFSPGDLVAVRGYWWRLFGPIQTLARVNDMVQRATAAGRRVFEVLDAPDELPDAPDAQSLQHVTRAMKLQNVTFAYAAEQSPMAKSASVIDRPAALSHGAVVLHDVTLDIPAGKTVALCGPSGSGKSTVLNLLLRFYDPIEGIVMLDGQDLRQIARTSLRSQFALVQQETFLFNDSILDNIRYGHSEATMDQVIVAARAANAHAFISAMPNSYDTRVGERGVRLSGGQKQRISIARAFLANPAILLLDEPTSSVEPDSEASIIAALDRLMTNRTTVVTSHRPSLILQADLVYVIEAGRVIAYGTPDEVAGQSQWFARFIQPNDPASMIEQ